MAQKKSVKKIVITGGAGYIGNTLIQALPQDVEVIVIDNFHIDTPYKRTANEKLTATRNVTLIEANVADVDTYRSALKNTDVVVYMASLNSHREANERPSFYMQENVMNLQRFFDTLHEESPEVQKCILTSSRGIYGEGVYTCVTCGATMSPEPAVELVCTQCSGTFLTPQLLSEAAPAAPSSYYGLTKKLQEDVLRQYCLQHNIPLDVIRIFNVFGEDQGRYYSHIGIISMMHSLITTKHAIDLYGNGTLTRDFIHVQDVVAVLKKSIWGQNQRDQLIETYNLGSGLAVSITDLADFFSEAGYQFSRNPIATYGDVAYSVAGNTKARKAFGIDTFINLYDFLTRNFTPSARKVTL